MAKKTDHLTFGAVWRWVSGGQTLTVMVIGQTSDAPWIREERRVIVLRDGVFSASASYRRGQITVFNGFADRRWQRINV